MQSRLTKAFGRRAFLTSLPALVPAAVGCGRWAAGIAGSRAMGDGGPMITAGPVLQNATETSVDIMFEADGGNAEVHWGLTAELGQVQRPRDTVSHSDQTIFHMTLAGLDPGTRYFYRVKTDAVQSETYDFRTPPVRGTRIPFKFAVYSDCQQNPSVHDRIVQKALIEPGEELAMVLVVGDIVQHGQTYWEYFDRFFQPIKRLSPRVPYYTVIGNHEADSGYYFDYMSLPRNGTPGYEEHWYSFDYGNAHFVGLDTNKDYRGGDQLAWLETDLEVALADARTDMVFVYFHHPWKSELWPPGEEEYSGEIIKRIEAALAKHQKPGAYFHGHTHGYSRGQSKDAPLFWVNVGSAGGHLDRWGDYPEQRPYEEIQRSYDDFGVVTFSVNAGGAPGFDAVRLSFGNDQEPVDAVPRDGFGATVGQGSPSTPRIERTLRGGLTATAYADPAGLPHLETEWQFSATPDFAAPLAVKWLRREKIYRDTDLMAGVDLTALSPGTEVTSKAAYVRVRYRNERLSWSAWSELAPLS